MSLLLDVGTVCLLLAAIYASYRKGLIRSIIEMVGYILSLIVAVTFSDPFGNWLYAFVIKPLFYNRISDHIAADVSKQTMQTYSQLGSLGQFIQQYGGSGLVDAISKGVKNGENAVVNSLMNTMVQPLLQNISRVLAFVLVFTLCLFLVRVVARLTDIVFKMPLIRQLNQVGGLVVGLVKGVILMFIVSTIITLLIPIFSLQEKPLITNNTISSTSVYKYIDQINPLTQMLLKKS